MVQSLDYLKESPSQTAGPYVHIGLAPDAAGFRFFDHAFSPDPADEDAPGEAITVEGCVYDGAGAPVKDVLLEVWQANADGVYPDAGSRIGDADTGPFRGWGRIVCDFDTGEWRFNTVKPGGVPGRSGHGSMAPHISFWIVARGINVGLNTRMYFADEEKANAADPVLNLIEQETRRSTLIASRSEHDGRTVYRFDIHLQGDAETVFFDI